MDPNSVQAMIDGADNDDSLSLLSYDSCSDDLGSLPTDEAEQEQLMDELDAPRTAELRAPITPGAAESTTLTAERLTEWIEVQRPSLAAPLSTPLHSHPRARSSPAGSGWIHGRRHVSSRHRRSGCRRSRLRRRLGLMNKPERRCRLGGCACFVSLLPCWWRCTPVRPPPP